MSQHLALLRRVVRQSAYLKNTLALLSGTFVTQAIVFIASPILSRIFGLEDFGNLANFNAWVSLLMLFGNLRYEHAILVAKGPEKTGQAIALTALLSLASFVAYALIAAGIYFFFHGAGYLAHLKSIVLFIPFGTLSLSLSSLFIQFNVKSGRFKRLASVTAMQVAVALVPQVLLGKLHVRHALILGTIVGCVFSAAVFAWFFVREEGMRGVRAGMSAASLRATAREHLNFPRYTLAADAVTVVSQQFIPVFILALFNPAVAGLYAFSIRVVRVPLIVLSTAVAGALRKEAIDLVHGGRSLAGLFSVTVRSLALISLLPLVVVLLFAEPLFGFVFGHQWTGAGRVVQILSPGILFEFIALPLTTFFLVTNTQRYIFAIQVGGFVLLVLALFAGKRY
ncbi:MAG TPA: oligosaccharide flippase family protein [Gemmatimonadaceae bacterium]|nr:oligosaccharide flippase family protein [Gemmatimonadaceae bacterium]